MKGKFFKNKTFWLGAAAIVMAGSLTAQSAMAYFTTYVKAKGGYEITLGSETEIEEKIKDMTKEITISNTGREMITGRLEMTDTGIIKMFFRQEARVRS